MRRHWIAVSVTVAVLAFAGAACGSEGEKADTASAVTPASDLRLALTRLLGEHVNLAAAATGQALGGNMPGFQAAAKALEGNSNDIAAAVGSVYGDAAQRAFDPLWKKHIGFFVDYTTGKASGDKGKQDKAVADLTTYAQEFGAFIESATEQRLTKSAVAGLVTDHILGLKGVVDAQAAKDFTKAYTELRPAYAHMQMIADGLATAIVDQFPDKF
jgi:hypothetical protein